MRLTRASSTLAFAGLVLALFLVIEFISSGDGEKALQYMIAILPSWLLWLFPIVMTVIIAMIFRSYWRNRPMTEAERLSLVDLVSGKWYVKSLVLYRRKGALILSDSSGWKKIEYSSWKKHDEYAFLKLHSVDRERREKKIIFCPGNPSIEQLGELKYLSVVGFSSQDAWHECSLKDSKCSFLVLKT